MLKLTANISGTHPAGHAPDRRRRNRRRHDGRLLPVGVAVSALLLTFGTPGTNVASAASAARRSTAIPTWTELIATGTAPAPPSEPKIAGYDQADNRLVVVTHQGRALPDQVSVLTNANGLHGKSRWIPLKTTGPAPQSTTFETENYDPETNRLIVYGGCSWACSPSLDGVFVLTHANGFGGTPQWSQLAVTNAQPRDSHSAVYRATGDQLIVFGGDLAFPATDQNDTRSLGNATGIAAPSTWSTFTTVGGAPPVRIAHSATYDGATDRMTIFGGDEFVHCCAPNNLINDYRDTWVLSNASGTEGPPTWTQLLPTGAVPSPRSYHSAVYSPRTGRMYVYGGAAFNEVTQSYEVNAELWVLDHANGQGGMPTWTQLATGGRGPGPRFLHTAALDPADQRMIVLGGRDQSQTQSSQVFVLALGNQ